MNSTHQLNIRPRPLPPKFGNDSRLDSHKEVEQFSQSDVRGPGGNRACLGGRSTSDITYPAATGVKPSPPKKPEAEGDGRRAMEVPRRASYALSTLALAVGEKRKEQRRSR